MCKCSVSWCVSVGTPGQRSGGHEVRKERGKGGGNMDIEKDVVDCGDTVPWSPLAFNNSTEAWDSAWSLV